MPHSLALGARRDAQFIRRNMTSAARWFGRIHHVAVEGFEHVPEGPALLVGNHNGGIMVPDTIGLLLAWWERFGVDEPTYGLAHDLAFRVPVFGRLLARVGAVPAHQDNARELLRRGAKVLVYPGSDLDAFRPWSQRAKVVFGERSGFVKVALRTGAPIVPIVAAGAHEGFRVLTDGRRLARWLGLKRFLRVEVMPVALCVPWGLAIGPIAYLPVPLRIRIRVLPPIDLGHPPEAADDPLIVAACRERVLSVMQGALDDLSLDKSLGSRVL